MQAKDRSDSRFGLVFTVMSESNSDSYLLQEDLFTQYSVCLMCLILESFGLPTLRQRS